MKTASRDQSQLWLHDGNHLKTGCIRVRSFRTGHCLRCKEMCVGRTYLVYHWDLHNFWSKKSTPWKVKSVNCKVTKSLSFSRKRCKLLCYDVTIQCAVCVGEGGIVKCHSSVCLGLLGSLQHHTGGQDWSRTDKWTCPAYLSTHTETGTHTRTDGGTVSYVSNLMEIWPGLTSWKSDPLVNGVAEEMRGWKRER